jgi:hypothetical protein
MAQAIGVIPLPAAIEGGLVPEGPVPAPEIPVTAGAVGGHPLTGAAARPRSIRHQETGEVRTLGAKTEHKSTHAARQSADGWDIGSNRADLGSGRQGSARKD